MRSKASELIDQRVRPVYRYVLDRTDDRLWRRLWVDVLERATCLSLRPTVTAACRDLENPAALLSRKIT